MRWLEGWFGTASGVLGALIVLAVGLLTPAYSVASSCVSVDGGAPDCTTSSAPIGPQLGPLILYIVLFVLFVLIVVGTWLDLSGRRTLGRLILLISVTLLLPVWLVAGPVASHGSFALVLAYPWALMSFVAGILACVRRDTPRVAVVAPTMPAPTTMQPPAAPPSAPLQS
ncbi:MAG TPA: hypothetical protein VIC27_10665 [Ktedonobacterales bacterium]|jgi:hypothetical protein